MDKNKKKSLELYIHIPFCERKCLYCDFLSFRGGRDVQAEYMDQLRCEIGASGPWYSEYRVDTIFIGGGTPSVLEPEQITLLNRQEIIAKVEHEIKFQRTQAGEYGSGIFKDDVIFARYDQAAKILEWVLELLKGHVEYA